MEKRENPKFEIRHEVQCFQAVRRNLALTTKQIQMTKAQNPKQKKYMKLSRMKF